MSKSKRRDMDGIFGILNDNKDKTSNSDHLLSSKAKRKRAGEKGFAVSLGFDFRERVCNFSLRSQSIGPSVFDGARSKAVLHSEGFAWVLVLGNFDKLREVGVLSYLKLHFV